MRFGGGRVTTALPSLEPGRIWYVTAILVNKSLPDENL
jgi:hypothetical protein